MPNESQPMNAAELAKRFRIALLRLRKQTG
jgi:hypothetical protein